MFIEIEMVNLLTNWDCTYFGYPFCAINHLAVLASAASQLPLREQGALQFQRYVWTVFTPQAIFLTDKHDA